MQRAASLLRTSRPLSTLAARAQIRKMHIHPVPVRDDNYAYIIQDGARGVFVDPFHLPTVQAAAKKHGVEQVMGCITTHHHQDHSGGNPDFAKAYPDVPIWGGSDKCPAMTKQVRDQDAFELWQGSKIDVKCHATPCHTQDSMAWHLTDADGKMGVFTGDTLFVGGCGRFFEGTPQEMHHALNKVLASLPDKTVLYCGHEYTKGNIGFGAAILPERPAVKELLQFVRERKNNGVTTGVFTIGDEKKHNVFMLVDDAEVKRAAGLKEDADAVEVMGRLREMKNEGKISAKV